MTSLPEGMVTFLFTDIEGSTRLWEQYPNAMPAALARHNEIISLAVEQNGGVVFQVIGDAYWSAFQNVADALNAALSAQRGLYVEPWSGISPLKVRMALHTGAAIPTSESYVGATVSKLACLVSAGHGGQALLSQASVAALEGYLPDGVSLRDMGERRLRDLPQPEHLYQLIVRGLPSEFPPLKTLDVRHTNLPLQTDSFIGRETECAALSALLRRPDVRLLTLTGAGGGGKTRLSLQLAGELLDEYDDGIYFVALAAIDDPELVIPAIAQTLGVKEVAGETLSDSLRRYLRERQIMLLLDNFEQVVDAATVVAELLAAAPGLRIMVSSREALRIYGEQEYPVPPLALPDSGQAANVAEVAAVQLFVQRAQAVAADFTLDSDNQAAIVEICRWLDGLPLAIELAAARVRQLDPRLMLARWQKQMGDGPLQMLASTNTDDTTRQQSLRAAFNWSYDLLSVDEQVLFARLAVFASSYSIEAVEQVCNAPGLLPVDCLLGLPSLAEKSLLRLLPSLAAEQEGGENRFTMLTVIREYAAEKLKARAETDTLQRAHCEYYLKVAEQSETELRGAQQAGWLERLETAHDDLRAALVWAAQHDSERLLRLAGALRPFWLMRSYLSEGRYWLEAALAQADSAAGLRAKVALGAGVLAHEQGDYRHAVRLFEQSLSLYRGESNQRGIANALTNLGLAADEQGDHDHARQMLEEALAIWRELDNQAGIASILGNLGLVVKEQGDYATARALQEESLELRRKLEDDWGMAIARDNLGELAFVQHDYAAACQHFAASMSLRHALGHKRGLAMSLERFATIAVADGQMTRAARLFGAEEAIRDSLSVPVSAAEEAVYARSITTIRSHLSEVEFNSAWALGKTMTLEQAIEYALQEQATAQADPPTDDAPKEATAGALP